MAEKNDREDEKDEKDEHGEEEEAEEKAAAAGKKDEDDEDDDEEEEAKPAARATATSAAAKPAVPKRAAAPLARTKPRAGAAPVRKGGSFGKSLILFVVIVGGLAGAFALLGREDSAGPAAPKWKTGDTADIDLTVVADDKKNLACATPDEIGGAHCAFEAQAKPWSKGDSADDKKLLKPYTSVDRIQVLASGLWSDPALAGTLPTTRFTVKCKFKVEGKMKAASIRWASDGPWYDSKDIYSGSLSACKLVQ